jgi:hypothetical protein
MLHRPPAVENDLNLIGSLMSNVTNNAIDELLHSLISTLASRSRLLPPAHCRRLRPADHAGNGFGQFERAAPVLNSLRLPAIFFLIAN